MDSDETYPTPGSKLEQIREALLEPHEAHDIGSTSDTNILPDTDEGPPPAEPGEMQPLPSFDDLVVPETQPYTCAECGQIHEGPLVSMTPLGNMQVQLQYQALPECPTPKLGVVDGGPVIREAHDG